MNAEIKNILYRRKPPPRLIRIGKVMLVTRIAPIYERNGAYRRRGGAVNLKEWEKYSPAFQREQKLARN